MQLLKKFQEQAWLRQVLIVLGVYQVYRIGWTKVKHSIQLELKTALQLSIVIQIIQLVVHNLLEAQVNLIKTKMKMKNKKKEILWMNKNRMVNMIMDQDMINMVSIKTNHSRALFTTIILLIKSFWKSLMNSEITMTT